MPPRESNPRGQILGVREVKEVREVRDECLAADTTADDSPAVVLSLTPKRSDNFSNFFNFSIASFIYDSFRFLYGFAVGIEDGRGLLDLRPEVVGHRVRVVADVVRQDDVVAAFLE